ncbi:MAG: PQQ-dependent sugar dehydrogenase [Gammaproteobacteria bacterium]|nr:PQQ-dependent sugar dehydrogenase [Gammaproteobacteria bacterium]
MLIACADNAATQPAQAPQSPTPAPVDAPIQTSVVADGLEHPWGLEFLPDGRMLVTERPGRLRIVDNDGTVSEPLGGVPEVYTSSQGGLLDVALSPAFESDRLIYLSFSEPDGDVAGTAVARGKLSRNGLRNVEVIWRQTPKINSSNHWGSRIAFAPDGTLFVTTGDRYDLRQDVQDLSTTIGKVIRINADGTIPQDNPFVDRPGTKPEIWSYGHRNLQGAAIHPETDQLWTLEHGAMGGDELNHPKAGLNYGWPVITYGVDYTGVKIGEGVAKKGMEQPVYFWDPVIAPSGALFYTGTRFPDWRGDLFVGSLAESVLVRLDMQGGRVASETRFLEDVGERVRDVRQGPDGLVYVITDESDGKIIKLAPAG